MIDNDIVKQHLISIFLAATITLLLITTLSRYYPQQAGLLLSKMSSMGQSYLIQLGFLPYPNSLRKEEQSAATFTQREGNYSANIPNDRKTIEKSHDLTKKLRMEVAKFQDEKEALSLQSELFSHNIGSEVIHAQTKMGITYYRVMITQDTDIEKMHLLTKDIITKLDITPKVNQTPDL